MPSVATLSLLTMTTLGVSAAPGTSPVATGLHTSGWTGCGVPAGTDNIVMCHIGNAIVKGIADHQRGTSSYCRDVATGLRWILENCGHNNNQEVAGGAVAWGNGDLLVDISDRE
ncbi:hypothetical protein NLG97_g9800 [Lecanicillium saksenae]|uniref:Uncharacterized protein n=1 Tax=Lecanicillium saksenae TaxID=468837 RepID=A0ACC1QGU1_9HYPO|nr:hypothetical protein NLG97_g9800 [Lecanicillium saksenae]